MNAFSTESQFIQKNWDRVDELMKAVGRCESEMTAYLHSLEGILKNEPWWHTGLKFVANADNQCYISCDDWANGSDECVIWIGVENFSPYSIFTAEDPPSCYLWLQSRAAEIGDAVMKYVERDKELKKYLAKGTYGQKSRYLLKKKLRRWYPEEIDEFGSGAPLREVATFMASVYQAIQGYKLRTKGRD